MSRDRIPVIPDDWSVWAFSDAHGVTSGFVAALQLADLIDADRHWVAPPRTALVGCGDYIDRGGDIAGLVALMQTLAVEAEAAGSVAHYARGNHEVMPLMIRDESRRDIVAMWLEYGGASTLTAYGASTRPGREPAELATEFEAAAPGVYDWLAGLPQAVRWRDVLFVHAGLVPGFGLGDLGTRTEDHIWIRDGFYATDWDHPGFDAYRADGIGRVVFGHTPRPDGPVLYHGGRSIDIDTNAVGNPQLPPDAARALMMMKLGDGPSFDDATIIRVDTSDAPEGSPRSTRGTVD